MMKAPKPLEDSFRKAAQLREIGVEEAILLAALQEGDAGAARCTANHPPMAPGFFRFAETVRSLADQLAPLGWVRRDYKNFSTVVSPDGRVAIAVASGDDGTGDLFADVTTRSPKGAATYEAIDRNLSLPLDERYEADNKRPQVQTATWFLLHDRREGKVYAELSLPKYIVDGYVQTWEPRIALSPLPLDVHGAVPSERESPVNPEVDIKRRGV